MATLPDLTRRLDDDFVNTWYEIRAQVMDNILEATILTLALKEHNTMSGQPGGEFGWTDTIGYGQKATQRFQKGSTLNQSTPQLDTFARLDWRFYCVDINRSFVDDNKNMGPYQIKSYIGRRLEAARDALVQDTETYLTQWGGYYSAPNQINGLWDICAPSTALSAVDDGAASDSYASGTSNGNLSRANTWWRNWVAYEGATQNNANKIAGTTGSYAADFVDDLDHMYNCVQNNQEAPNFILTTQLIYESYGAEARDTQQIVKSGFNKMAADLGFDTYTYRGATLAYSTKITTLHVLLLNMNYITWKFHPNAWFDMTGWRDTANQLERVAYIVNMTPGLATSQPRRHGVMLYEQ